MENITDESCIQYVSREIRKYPEISFRPAPQSNGMLSAIKTTIVRSTIWYLYQKPEIHLPVVIECVFIRIIIPIVLFFIGWRTKESFREIFSIASFGGARFPTKSILLQYSIIPHNTFASQGLFWITTSNTALDPSSINTFSPRRTLKTPASVEIPEWRQWRK